MDAAAQLAVESLKLALEQLKKSWGAYQSNYTDAEAVFEYAQRVLRIMDHWAGANGVSCQLSLLAVCGLGSVQTT